MSPAEMKINAQQQQQPAFFTSPAELEQIARTRPVELIEDFVPSGGVMVLAGAPGLGKSFTALSWAAAIAEGSEWFGRRVRQAPVVYVLGEGWGGFGDRIAAWQKDNGRPMSEQVHFVNGVPLGVNLKDPDAVQQLIAQVEPVRPGLIIVDTFSVLARVSNENDNAEVAAVMFNVNAIAQATGATVMLVHHVTKTTGSVRGASAFVGNADTVVVAGVDVRDGAASDGFMLSTEARHGGKQRDGEAKTLRGFKITWPGVLDRDDVTGAGQYNPNAVKDPNEIMAKAMAVHESKKEQEN